LKKRKSRLWNKAVCLLLLPLINGCGMMSPGAGDEDKARDLFETGEYKKALEYYDKAFSKMQAASYVVGQGNCKLALNDFAGADAAFGKLAKMPPEAIESVRAKLGQGVILLEQDKFDAALPKLAAGLASKDINSFGFESTKAALFMAQALSQAKLKKETEAIASADEAIKVLPSSSHPLRVKAHVLRILGKNEEALAMDEKVVGMDNSDYLNLLDRGLTKNILKKYEDALKDFDKSIELEQRFALAYEARAVAHAKLGNKEAAQRDRAEAQTKLVNGKNWHDFAPDIIRPW